MGGTGWGAGVHTITSPPQMAVNALHHHVPAREVQSHQHPYFLFSESQTQSLSILPARISKDITSINTLRERKSQAKALFLLFQGHNTSCAQDRHQKLTGGLRK